MVLRLCIPCARVPEYSCVLLNECCVHNVDKATHPNIVCSRRFCFHLKLTISMSLTQLFQYKSMFTCYLLQIMPYIFLFYFSNRYTFKNCMISLLETVGETDFWGTSNLQNTFAWIMFASFSASNVCVKIKPCTIPTSFKTLT